MRNAARKREQRERENVQIKALLDSGQTPETVASIIGISIDALYQRIHREKDRDQTEKAVEKAPATAVIAAERFDAFNPGGQMLRARDRVNNAIDFLSLSLTKKEDGSINLEIFPVLLSYLKEVREQVKLCADVSQQIASAQAQREFEGAVAAVLQKVSPETREMLTNELRLLRENRMAVTV